jgi:hypothetical protein
MVTLPSADVSNTAYPSLADVLALFAGTIPAEDPAETDFGLVRMDGTVSLAITGRGRTSAVIN